MATTKIFPITVTESKAFAYIGSPAKTENRRLIYAYGCSPDPYQASRDFEAVRALGTKRNSVLSQHFIQSFAPGEITPEKALEVGKELADKLLHGEYQYYLAVHTDTTHIHVHCIFNNVNSDNHRTFETLENRKSEFATKKLMKLSDEICRKHGLSVIEDHESSKGKSYYEWTVDQLHLSWKSKLKYAIDQVIKVSDNFVDFLKKCADFGVLVDYNPSHKIDLKFMLAEQREPQIFRAPHKRLPVLASSRGICLRLYSESFTSPEVQTPKDTVEKLVKVQNTGSVPCFVRVYLDLSDSRLSDGKVRLSADGTNYFSVQAFQNADLTDCEAAKRDEAVPKTASSFLQ